MRLVNLTSSPEGCAEISAEGDNQADIYFEHPSLLQNFINRSLKPEGLNQTLVIIPFPQPLRKRLALMFVLYPLDPRIFRIPVLSANPLSHRDNHPRYPRPVLAFIKTLRFYFVELIWNIHMPLVRCCSGTRVALSKG